MKKSTQEINVGLGISDGHDPVTAQTKEINGETSIEPMDSLAEQTSIAPTTNPLEGKDSAIDSKANFRVHVSEQRTEVNNTNIGDENLSDDVTHAPATGSGSSVSASIGIDIKGNIEISE